jgi:hypothetical protein
MKASRELTDSLHQRRIADAGLFHRTRERTGYKNLKQKYTTKYRS